MTAPKHVKLDRIDRRILRELQKDGRMTNVDLAREAGISAPPCLRRVRALEEAGYIRGYYADIAAEKLGYGLTVFVHVALGNHAEADLAHFARLVDGWPQVRECHMLAGESDFLLKVVAQDLEAFQRFLTTQLTSAPNVQNVKSLPALRRTKWDPGVPVEEPAAEPPGRGDAPKKGKVS